MGIKAALVALSVVALVGGVSTASQASNPTLVAVDGVGAPNADGGRWVDEYGYVRLPLQELEHLVGKRAPSEIAEALASGRALNTLVDIETGAYLVAIYAERSVRGRALKASGCGDTGHAKSNQAVGGRAKATCFNGTGDLTISLPNTYWLSAGERTTRWKTNYGHSWSVPAFSSATLVTPISVVAVSR